MGKHEEVRGPAARSSHWLGGGRRRRGGGGCTEEAGRAEPRWDALVLRAISCECLCFGNYVKLTIIPRLTETECVLVQSTEGRSVVPVWETQTLMQIFDR